MMLSLFKRLRTFWEQPCGIREILVIAVPLMVSTVCYSVMQFVDRLFLFQHSEMEAGAIVTVGSLVWTLISLPLGMVGYVSTFIAQYRGAHRWDRIGRSITHAVYLFAACVPLVVAPVLVARWIFLAMGHGEALTDMQTQCFSIYILSGIGMLAGGILDGVLVGVEKNRPVMYANILGTIVNLALDPLLIFGWGFVPEMGIVGASWATVIGMWVKFFYTLYAVTRLEEFPEFRLSQSWKWDPAFFWRFVYYGFPSGFQWAVEGAAMTYFVLVMGRLGDRFLAATSLTFSVNMLAFVPIYGLGMGLSAIVGNQLGSDNKSMAIRSIKSGLTVALAYTSVFALAYIFMPDLFLMFHQGEGEQTEIVQEMVTRFLFFVAVYCLLDAIQITMVSALKGAGDTWFITATISLSSIIFVVAGLVFENYAASKDQIANGWWLLLTTWLMSLAFVYSARVLGGKWLEMRVIETDG